jgi:sulfate permease, SulP family
MRALARYLPIAGWLPRYRRDDLPGDIMAGIIVAIVLVPQGMAYAMLANLPPEIGLYASLIPPVLYGIFGTSRALAVGPVAIMSLMTASATAAYTGGAGRLEVALVLALISGLLLLAMGLLRLGLLVNFLSHPVISGFTSAAALVIAFSQLRHLLGLEMAGGLPFGDTVWQSVLHLTTANAATACLGLGSIVLLLAWRGPVARLLKAIGVPGGLVGPIAKGGPLVVVAGGTLLTGLLHLDGGAGVATVGAIPEGLPALGIPSLDPDLWAELAPAAVLIAIVGFLESVSVARALASKRRQRIDANQELIALGSANIGAAFTGAYPVAGGFGRSVVNFSSGAATPLASIITALLIGVTLLVLTPLFHDLPRAVLAAIIVVAVAALIDVASFRRAWRYDKADAAAQAVTFGAVLAIGVELGIVAGIVLSLLLHLWRTSRPHVAVVGRVGNTEHFRNVRRHTVTTLPHVLAVRVDESLYFANASYLEGFLLNAVADDRLVRHVVLICSAVNVIDASALESLETLSGELRDAGVTLHLAEVKGPVSDRLARTGFLEHLAPGRVFLSTHEAMVALAQVGAGQGAR